MNNKILGNEGLTYLLQKLKQYLQDLSESIGSSIVLSSYPIYAEVGEEMNIYSSQLTAISGKLEVNSLCYDLDGNIGVLISSGSDDTGEEFYTLKSLTKVSNPAKVEGSTINYESIDGIFELDESSGMVKLKIINGESNWINSKGNIKVDKKAIFLFEINGSYSKTISGNSEVYLQRLSDSYLLAHSSFSNRFSPINYIGELSPLEEYKVGTSLNSSLIGDVKWKLTLISGYGPFWEES